MAKLAVSQSVFISGSAKSICCYAGLEFDNPYVQQAFMKSEYN
ncbi:MAG: hypothetical protein OFPI_43000 [Osedax symbiont Rs2]|nr:MAG: hypothetical protein OFPI_43000 [Osedax symbiont Rs2]